MRRTLEITEQAMGLQESWPKFAPGGDKKNGYWIALAAYAHGPKGPTAAALREAITKKLSGKSAEATRGKTAYNTPLLPKLRDVFVRGAEIPGVSANSMTEYSDVLVYVVEFDTYIPKLLEIAEGVLEDLVLSKKDEYDWANGPVEPGHSSLHSAAKTLRLDMDSVYSATDARQRRYMGEAVLDEADPARDAAARDLKKAMRRVEFLLKDRVANADAVRVLALVPMYMSGRGDTPDDGYLAIAAYRIQRNSEIILVSHRVTFGDGVEPDLAHLHAPFAYTSSVQIDDPSGVANSVKELIGLVKRFDSPLSKALSREGMIKELSAFLRSQGLMEDLQEEIDPEVFGEFRSFLASPYLSAKANGARPSFLFSAAEKLGSLIKKYGDEARDILVPYADGVMSRVDAKYRTIGPYSETSLLMGEGGKHIDNVDFVVDFIKKHHSGLQIDTFNIDQTGKLDLFMSLNLGPGDGRIHFITENDVIESKRIGELMEFAYSNGRKEIDISSSMPDIAGVAHDLKFLSTVIPSGASVVFKAYSLSHLRGVPVRSLVNGVLRRRKIKGTNKKLKAEISFHQLQRTSGGGPLSAHAAILDDAVSQDIIHSYIIAGDTLVLVFN